MTERDDDGIDALLDSGRQAAASYERARPDRPEIMRMALLIAVAVCLVGMAAAILISVAAANQTAENRRLVEVAEQEQQANRAIARDAYDAAMRANAELERRGQHPVPVPRPDSSPPADTIASAAAARVMASLPAMEPSEAELGRAVARYLADHPQAPSESVIAGHIADYLSGVEGERGPAPSAEQITAAVADYCGGRGDCRGPRGVDGEAGEPPAGWRVHTTSGEMYECERVAGFDPAAPRYECAPEESEGDDDG